MIQRQDKYGNTSTDLGPVLVYDKYGRLKKLAGAGGTGVQGPQGPAGGPQGVQGSQGRQGEIGPQGVQGEIGPQGDLGTQGPQGVQGVQGEIGPQGIEGGLGTQGPQGVQGVGGALGYFGNFIDTTDQPFISPGTAQIVAINTNLDSVGFSLSGTGSVVIDNPGTYTMIYSIQLINFDNEAHYADIWLRFNGSDYPDSTTRFHIPERKNATEFGYTVATVNYVGTSINPGDYVELWWSADSTNVSIEHLPPGTSPVTPSVPSVISTFTQVMYTQEGPQGPQGTFDYTLDGNLDANNFNIDNLNELDVESIDSNLYPKSLNASTWSPIANSYILVNAQDSSPRGITFKPDGTKMFIIGSATNRVFEYDLSTPWDVTTAIYSNVNFYVGTQTGGTCEDLYIKEDGTTLYTVGSSSDRIAQYTLDTPWSLSSVTYVQFISINTYMQSPSDVYFKNDGTKMYVLGYTIDSIYTFDLPTPWDISTFTNPVETDISGYGFSTPSGLQINSDGTKMYVIGYGSDRILEFDLLTPWDVSTLLRVATSPRTSLYEGTAGDIYYNDQINKAFIVGSSTDRVYELDTSPHIDITTNLSVSGDLDIKNRLGVQNISGFYSPANFYSYISGYSDLRHDGSFARIAFAAGSPGAYIANNTITGTGVVQIGYNVYRGTAIDSKFTLDLVRNLWGAKSNINIGVNTSDPYDGGVLNVTSHADSFYNKGNFQIGRTLAVDGDQTSKLKEDNFYLEGDTIFLDNFVEAADTDITLHTPDVGTGYSLALKTFTSTTYYPIVEGGSGFMRPNISLDNQGYVYVANDTIASDNYEVRATIRRQQGSDDVFWLIARYQDPDNFYAVSFATSYSYAVIIKKVGGVVTYFRNLAYYTNPSVADNLNIEVAIRVIDDNISIFYDGEYRGGVIDSDLTTGIGGFGFGAIVPTYSSYEIDSVWRISQFRITEMLPSMYDGSDSVHYINKGSVAIGGTTTESSAKLEVNSTTQGFLPPRMTNAERLAIVSPAVGLVVYCTDAAEGLYTYTSSGWKLILNDVQVYKNISSDTTIDDTYHNAVVWVSSTCNITIPSGLRSDFNCTVRTLTSVIATYLTSGTVISAESDGNIQAEKTMSYIAQFTTNNFIISGGGLS